MSKILNELKHSPFIHLCFAFTFFTSGIIINLIQCIFYCLLRPINKYLYRKINWYLCFTIYAQLVFLADWWSNTKLIVYMNLDEYKKYLGKEHAYCIMNHTYEIDWVIGWKIANCIHLLGNCKAYAKKIIQYVPVLGWGWKFSEFVFLERSFDKDKDIINKQIIKLAEHPDPMWLLLFPEGTRFTDEKHKISLEFAKTKNLPKLKHHLLPRTKGFIASLGAMKGRVPAVYDIVVAFDENEPIKPTIHNMLIGRNVTAHLYFRRIPLDQLPDNDVDLEKFLRDMFVRKDQMLDNFKKTGNFFSNDIKKVDSFPVERRLNTLINFLFWIIITICPMFYYLINLIRNGEWFLFSIGLIIIGAFYILLKKTIGMSEIRKSSSSYGTNTPKKIN